MRFGITLPQFGPVVEPGLIANFAREAEESGYQSLWVGDRVLAPLQPSQPYPGYTAEKPLPDAFGTFLDPLTVLTAAATAAGRDPGSLRRELRVNLVAGPDMVDAAIGFVREARELGYDGAFADPQFAVGSPAEMVDCAGQLMAAYRAG